MTVSVGKPMKVKIGLDSLVVRIVLHLVVNVKDGYFKLLVFELNM